MIIAIFAMVFLFGVTAVLFSLVSGENSSASGSVTAQSAQEAADAGLQQGVKAVQEKTAKDSAWHPTLNTKSETNANGSGEAEPSCPANEGTGLSENSVEQGRNHEQKYCFTVICPEKLKEEKCEAEERTITSFGAARDYESLDQTGKPSYTYAKEQKTIKVEKGATGSAVRAQASSQTATSASSRW
jgi:hypothetical protein